MKRMSAWLVSLAMVSAIGSVGCATETGEEWLSGDGDEEMSREGDDFVSEDELKLGDANRAGFAEPNYSASQKASLLRQYSHVDPQGVVPQVLLENALQYYHFNKARLENDTYLTVIDMGIHSGRERLFLINMDNGRVERKVVSHGAGSDPQNRGIPTRFSNVSGSNATSLGYYKTAETYNGSNGYSMRLDGLSATNSNARPRAVVVHGANYVSPGRAQQGRSWGCPAVPMAENRAFIQQIRGGSLLYIDTTDGASSR